jgi:1-deoxy-D-xylulose-5-phosphate reductoisomerase
MDAFPSAPRPRCRRVVLLGATGSIGLSTLEVARQLPDHMQLVGLAARSQAAPLARAATEFGVKHVALSDPAALPGLQSLLPSDAHTYAGPEGLLELVEACQADLALIAIVGTAGLQPALHALDLGLDLAVASKEILVLAGQLVMEKARASGRLVLPVDSEHNAIFQCLDGQRDPSVRRLILTASGGPFRDLPAADLAAVSVGQALAHPTWDMGQKISIDSATLFNKGLEMIEARWLFDVPIDKIEVVVHRQSIVHSMVEFADRSILAQLSTSDMCFPIQYAVTYPNRIPNQLAPLDFAALARLDFEPPREQDFPALSLARQAGRAGGTLPAVLNAANEVAVAAFLARQISFPTIWHTVAQVMDKHATIQSPDLPTLLNADSWARRAATETMAAIT